MVREPPTRTPPPSAPPRPREARPLPDQFAQLEARFEVLKARVRQAQQLAGLGAVAPTLAHEVNNLLTPIIGYAQSALESDDPELMKKALRVTLQNARIAARMAERLLLLSAAKPAERTAVVVREAIDDAYAGLCRDVTRDGITYTVEVPDGLTVWADALQLQQVLFNLFLNACEAMKGSHNGRLAVRAFETDSDRPAAPSRTRSDESSGAPFGEGTVTIEVRNGGKPIPSDLIPHVFDALASSKSTTNGQARCSGLGLALCRDLVEENGGSISVTSDAQHGTTFTIRIPVASGPSQNAPNPSN